MMCLISFSLLLRAFVHVFVYLLFVLFFFGFFDLAKSSSISTTPTFHRDPETRCCSTLRPRHMEFNIRAAHIDRRSTSTY